MGWSLDYRVDGPAGAPPLVLGPSLGTRLSMWDGQVRELARSWRVIRYDLPGHNGLSDIEPGATATVAELARQVLVIADAVGAGRFGYAGVSLGGAVGLWLAIHHPRRVTRLAVLCSSAHFGTERAWAERAELVRAGGTAALVDGARERWFAPGYADRAAGRASSLLDDLRTVGPNGYIACCDALGAFDVREALGDIAAPTLIVAGADDVATPVAHAEELAAGIGGRLEVLPAAGHLANVEHPDLVAGLLADHFAADGMAEPPAAVPHTDEQRLADGFAVRREVLGDAHVDASVANTTEFTADFQNLITRYAWGEIWTRPGLDRRTRSAITLTALVAHGHWEELAMHVRAAVRNGLSAEQIGEVLLQSAIYCGVPAANSAFRVAQQALSTP